MLNSDTFLFHVEFSLYFRHVRKSWRIYEKFSTQKELKENGRKNSVETLGNNEYARLRFGVEANFPKGRKVDYVLSPFSEDEQIDLPGLIEKAAEMAISFGAIGIEPTMNFYNTK